MMRLCSEYGEIARQRGVALVTAVMAVTAATVVAVAMVSRQQLEIRRTANLLESGQIMLYQQGIEEWASHLLRRDKEDNKTDHLEEDWATILPPIPVEGGQLGGRIEDMQGLFNLNNLVRPRSDGQGMEPDPLERNRFQRLLENLDLPVELTSAVIDWIDSDIDPSFPAGAEDDRYQGNDIPYRTANQPMASPSELLLVEGFDQESYEKLQPFVVTLPRGGAININTAPAEILRALGGNVTLNDAENLIDARSEDGFETVKEFLAHEALAGREIKSDGLAVESSYFVVRSSIQVGRQQHAYSAILHRAENQIQLLYRALGNE